MIMEKMTFFTVLILSGVILNSYCEENKKNDLENALKSENESLDKTQDFRSLRAIILSSVKDVAKCFGTLDGACFVDKAEDVLIESNRALWDEADKSVVATGKAEETTKPSALMSSINHFISEITDMFKDGLVGLFRDGKEDDGDEDEAEEDEEEEDEDDEDETSNESTEKDEKSKGIQGRGKKKKKKKGIIKLLLVGAVIATKIKLLLKMLAAHLQVKFLFIALASLFLNALRFYFDLKKGHQPQKVIYYEHAQHQHHYDGGDEDWHSGWSRSYVDPAEKEKKTGHDLAYAQQKPGGVVYSKVNDKPNYSWND